jgi:hypothetical protein
MARKISKFASVLLSAGFALGTVSMTFDFADARGGGGGGHGGFHGGGGMHSHGGGHHGGGGGHHGGGGGGHYGGGGGHHGGGNNNHHHHHNDDHYHYHDHWDDWDYWGGYAAGVATAAVVGSIVYSLPRGCRKFVSGGVTYWECGGVYYRAEYRGSDVTYVVVDRP